MLKTGVNLIKQTGHVVSDKLDMWLTIICILIMADLGWVNDSRETLYAIHTQIRDGKSPTLKLVWFEFTRTSLFSKLSHIVVYNL